jgi:acyl-CoA synthetase (AMP-forming)/AMP-acid ligase II
MPNGIEWAVIATAVTRVGAVLVPLSTRLRPPELIAGLRTAQATDLVIAEQSLWEELARAAPGVFDLVAAGRRHPALPALRQLWPCGELPASSVDAALVEALEDVVRPADDLMILFGSPGDPGPSKGVIHSHGNAIRATAAGLSSSTEGFSSGLMSALVAVASLLTEVITEPERTSASRFVMTETFGPYCRECDGSRGRPLEGIEVRIVDPGSGVECEPGTPGEIRLRGPNLMRGICGQTREETFDADGFYPSGDLGVLDSDGYLCYRGPIEDSGERTKR